MDWSAWSSAFSSYLRLPLKPLVAVVLATGGLLFLPPSLIDRFGFTSFLEDYRSLVGALSLISGVLVIAETGQRSIRFARDKLDQRRRKQRITDKMASLDEDEAAVVREFAIGQKTTVKMPIDIPQVAELLAQGVLVQVGRLGERAGVGMLFSVRLSREAKECISPARLLVPAELLEDSPGDWTLTDNGRVWATKNRAPFMRNVENYRRLFEEH